MSDKKYLPADITPGMVALLWDMPGFALLDVFKELVRRHDIESLQVVLGSDTLQQHPWADIPFHLLPLRDSEDPRARELYETWSMKMSAQDPQKMAHRLLYVCGLNDRDPKKRVELLQEIAQLVSLGVDMESPVGSSKRTPVGEAIKSINFHTARYLIAEFAKRNPDRLPLAAKGKDLPTFLLAHHINDSSMADILADTARVYDFSRPSLKVAASKAISKLAGEEGAKSFASNNAIMNLLALVEHDVIDADATRALWRMVGVDRFAPGASFFLSVAKMSAVHGDAKTLPALEKFLQAGIDVNARFPDGQRPVDYILTAGTEKFFATVLEAGVDVKQLQAEMKADPSQFKAVSGERIAMINSLVARKQIMDVVGANLRP